MVLIRIFLLDEVMLDEDLAALYGVKPIALRRMIESMERKIVNR